MRFPTALCMIKGKLNQFDTVRQDSLLYLGLRQGTNMPALQSSTGRHLLFVAALVGLASWAGGVSAIDPNDRGRLASAEPPPAPSKTAAAPKPEEKKIQFQRLNEPWKATLNWLA